MVRRRFQFAAPIVLVIASCKHPVAEPVEPEEEEEAPVVASASPADAAVEPADAAIDAPPDAPADAPVRAMKGERAPPWEQKATANPPSPLRARVLKTEAQGASIVVTFALGTDVGVDATTWRAWVVSDEIRPVPGGEVRLVRCDRRTCVGVVKLTYDQLKANPLVAAEPR